MQYTKKLEGVGTEQRNYTDGMLQTLADIESKSLLEMQLSVVKQMPKTLLLQVWRETCPFPSTLLICTIISPGTQAQTHCNISFKLTPFVPCRALQQVRRHNDLDQLVTSNLSRCPATYYGGHVAFCILESIHYFCRLLILQFDIRRYAQIV